MIDNSPYVNIHTHKKGDDELSITTLGVHPLWATADQKLTAAMVDDTIEAIGEIGLDFSRDVDKDLQIQLFESQLLLAQELALPVVVHAVKALDLTLQIVASYNLKALIFHGFIGSAQQAKRASDCGYYLSFGHRCFSSPKTIESLRATPLSQIFFETDDADISIEQIYHQGAELREESLEQIKKQLYTNYLNIFNKQ